MVQASLDTHRWVPDLGYNRRTHAHTGGKTDQAAALHGRDGRFG